MQTYYEFLNVPPTASSGDIEQAIESQYNQWRRLVTHHDPEIANQANQSLNTLEKIRTTLSHPDARLAYDATLVAAGQVGGLAEPGVQLASTQIPRPMVPVAMPPAAITRGAPAPPVGLWACGKCHTDNPPQTKFCFKCGTQLVQQCPACGSEASLITTGICGACGTSYLKAKRRLELHTEIMGMGQQLATLQQQYDVELKEANGGASVGCGGLLLFSGLVATCLAFQSSGMFVLAILLFVVGGGLFVSGYRGRVPHKNRAAELATTLNQLQQRQRRLVDEMNGTYS
ncbi:MAG: zinc ribbon domain-containing protein [Chloroflexota bacterium]|nr:zinc ribbon domain-containing protein [Chloroflexota bacterium]